MGKALPFKCRMIQGAAKDDAEVVSVKASKDGRYDVLVPVAFPDEGTFDWLDAFLAKNPDYVELSDRKILEWAVASGLWKPKTTGWKTSNDKPEFNFGLQGMDDFSIQRVLRAVAPVVPRNYVVMEVESNLIAEERKEVVRRFSAKMFKTTAHVVMGEPNEEFKKMQLDKLLKKKQLEIRQKQLMEVKKKAEEERKRKADEIRKKAEEIKKKNEAAKKAKEAAEKGEAAPDEEEATKME